MNSTIQSLGFVPEPDERGTISLLWGCSATILICSWSAVHSNIPPDNESQWRLYWRKFKYMMMGIIAPELVTTIALDEFVAMRRWRRRLKYRHPSSKKPWNLKQYFFLNSGGFAILRSPGRRIRPAPKELVRLIDTGIVDLPELECSDIDDRSKANWFTKSIAVVQITWFTMDFLGRSIQRLPITTLELFTLGIVLCAVLTYVFWWEKPFDIQRPIILHANCEMEDSEWPHDIRSVGLIVAEAAGWHGYDGFLIVISAIFGAVHIAGWNFKFPTEAEKMLWRISSLLCGLTPIVVVYCDWFFEIFESSYRSKSIGDVVLYVAICLYLLVRLILFVEMFAGLRDVSPDVYRTVQWSQFFTSFS